VIPFYDEIMGFLGISTILSSLYMQGQSFVDPTIRAIAIQSLIITALIVILFFNTGDLNLLYLAIITGIMRGIVFPLFMLYQVRHFKHKLRETGNQKTPSLVLAGIIVVIIGYAIFRAVLSPYFLNPQVSVCFILLLLGFLLIMTRKNYLTQMCGYIQEENAILYAGALIAPGIQILTEFAVVLDVLGVVIIGAILSAQRDVSKTFESSDLDELSG
jgi:hydrogenase-4 component E